MEAGSFNRQGSRFAVQEAVRWTVRFVDQPPRSGMGLYAPERLVATVGCGLPFAWRIAGEGRRCDNARVLTWGGFSRD
jgi:hypothetical protein